MLTWARWLKEWRRSDSNDLSRENILFLKLTEQGSTVLAFEALERAISRVGRDHVYFLVFEENRFILDLLKLVPERNVLTVDTHSLRTMATSFLLRLREIRRLRLSACFDLEFFSRSSVAIVWLTGAQHRVGFYSNSKEAPYRGNLLTHRVLFDPRMHTSRSFAMLVNALDFDQTPQKMNLDSWNVRAELPRFRPTLEEQIQIQETLRDLGALPGEPLIILNANAGDLLPLRKWSGENYVSLARLLHSRFPHALIVFTGSQDESVEIQSLVEAVALPRCQSLAGQTTLRQLMTLYTLADVLVTNDSGPAHFAALTDIEVVVLFGPETPALFGANTSRNHVLWASLPCSPCVNAYNNRQTACRNNICMQSISVVRVFETVCLGYSHRQKSVMMA
jgi:ADP-heptose:LPS heptosyltransferase